MEVLVKIKNSGLLGLKVYNRLQYVYHFFTIWIWPDRYIIKRKYKKRLGRIPDIDNPKRLTEKLQWIKLYDRNEFQTQCADKFAVREYISKQFGDEYLVPLLFETTNVEDITEQNLPDCNCILKANHDSGNYLIIRNKYLINYPKLRENCRYWLSVNYYYHSQEWQYKNIKPHRIIVEKLLETKEGKIPNDYKLHYINGELQFVYVSYDREGVNDRCTYDKEWNKLPFVWVPPTSYRENMNTADVPCPKSFELMKKFGAVVAKNFKYVRVDFYDVDGKLYFGEITLHHGSGMDKFFPEEYDMVYGNKLTL